MSTPRSENDLAAIYDAMACGVVVRDAAGAVVFANAAAKRIFGRAPEELEGAEPPGEDRRIREDGTTMPDDEVPNVAAQARGESIRNVMMGMVRADGYVRWLLVDAVPIKDAFGRVREVVSSFTDVTDRKKAEHELERLALHDPLTGLPNRSLLLDRLEQALRTARRLSTPLALLVMDLDRFKEINDTFGHPAGDLLIGEVAGRISADLRETDTVARLGGDEFALILPGADEGGAGHVAQKIIAALQRPFDVEGRAHEIAISIGIAVSPQHGEDVVPLQAAVNLSIRNLLDPELPRIVGRALERANVPAEWLAFEITETMLMAEPNRVLRTLAELRELGVQVAIDDFGVGYSSLAYLQRLPAYAVKIDRSFIGRMTRDRGSAEIVKVITNLGHALGMKVVAEGIEDQATYDACAAVGCDSAQGFFVGRPMVATAIPAWLAQGHRTTTVN